MKKQPEINYKKFGDEDWRDTFRLPDPEDLKDLEVKPQKTTKKKAKQK